MKSLGRGRLPTHPPTGRGGGRGEAIPQTQVVGDPTKHPWAGAGTWGAEGEGRGWPLALGAAPWNEDDDDDGDDDDDPGGQRAGALCHGTRVFI